MMLRACNVYEMTMQVSKHRVNNQYTHRLVSTLAVPVGAYHKAHVPGPLFRDAASPGPRQVTEDREPDNRQNERLHFRDSV